MRKNLFKFPFVLFLALSAFSLSASKDSPKTARPPLVLLPSLGPLIKNVEKGVVLISVIGSKVGLKADPFANLLGRFFEPPHGHQLKPETELRKVMAIGSGAIVDPAGYVVTNYHVIAEGIAEGSKITVKHDGKDYTAKVVGGDPKTDLAVLKISDNKPFPALTFAGPDTIQVGDFALAMGNHFGLGKTSTLGIVSAENKSIPQLGDCSIIQIDAAINPGSSGGPVFNMSGEIIGISTAIFSPNGGNVGVGFAIESGSAKEICDTLIKHGRVTRAFLGITMQDIPDGLMKHLKTVPEFVQILQASKVEIAGVVVTDVLSPKSPAAAGGLKRGDVIIQVESHIIKDTRNLAEQVRQWRVGSKVPITVFRQDSGQKQYKKVVLSISAEEAPRKTSLKKTIQLYGMIIAEKKDAPSSEDLRTSSDNTDVLVVQHVDLNSYAHAMMNISAGFLIVEANHEPVSTISDLEEAIKKDKNGTLLLFRNEAGEYQYFYFEKN